MPKRTTDYRSLLLEDLKDPEEAANYLTGALHDSKGMFLAALRDVAEANQMSKVASKVGVSRESLYRMLTTSGNPTYRNFFGILTALGLAFGDVRSRAERQSVPDYARSPRRRRGQRNVFVAFTATQSNEDFGSTTGERIPNEAVNPALPPRQTAYELQIDSANAADDNTPSQGVGTGALGALCAHVAG